MKDLDHHLCSYQSRFRSDQQLLLAFLGKTVFLFESAAVLNSKNTKDDWVEERVKILKIDGGAGKMAVHPAIEPLSYLIGTWRGEGEGGFPTISSFTYGEEINFTHPGNKPVIAYSQKTWKLNSGEPMHAESGYWRPKPDGTIEVVIAQSTGLAEIQKGMYDAEKKVVKLQSELVGNASKVKEITRVFTLVNEELSYVVEMATNLTDLQPHLKASLKKL